MRNPPNLSPMEMQVHERLRLSKPGLFQQLKEKGRLLSQVKELAQAISKKEEFHRKELLERGSTPDQAQRAAEEIAWETYLPTVEA